MGAKHANLHGSSAISLSYYFAIATLSLVPVLTTSLDTITPTQPLTSNQTIVSAAAAFELGFFSANNSQNRYLGIWYKQIPKKTIVWIANRDNPLTTSSSSTLRISQDGNLVLAGDQFSQNLTWSSNFTAAASSNTVAQLLDDGNFVVRVENDDDPANYLYQSFDHPTDTLLPGMKLGWDSKTGLNRMLTSWRGTDDPSTGVYSFEMDVSGLPEIYLWNGKAIEYRSGPWNGLRFSGVPEMNTTGALTFSFVTDAKEVTYSFGVTNKSLYSRLIVNPSGVLQRFTWIDTRQVWNLFWYAPDDQCDTFKECGTWGVCDTNNNPVCECLKGFEPKNKQAWDLRDGSDGCVRVSGLECKSDGFLRLKDMKLPDSSAAFVDRSMGREECTKKCREDCSCTAYASADIRGAGSGCVIWSEELVDMRQYAAAEGGQELFVRVSAADSRGIGSKTKSVKAGEIVGITIGVGILLGLTIFILWKKKRKQRALNENPDHRGSYDRSTQSHFLGEGVRVSKRDFSGERTTDELELPLFEFSTMAMATDNFCNENKLGQGGFGIVYKGLLVEGQEIAVKRLSKNSGQGVEEFKNEVKLIARLQHRNLVRLLGCCVEVEEKMLVYEYMENKSLDSILFSKEKCSLLDWQRRFNIICGIGRGLLYLHQDSRLRIIHRDLKASNILLDKEMNPKISDFGMARIFGGDQTEGDTMRVVGTYGYMAPEYAMDGHFSVKSDVFSFGVLVLEIVTGKKNRKFYSANQQLNLLGHAWKLWREGNGLELVDPSVGESYTAVEVLRCIQVGLLCVQERAEDRPTMSSVVLMLSSESTSLSQPKNPGFCLGRHLGETDSSSSRQDESCTLNNVTVTILDGR